ncbi:MAG: DUF551 domain-containing protein [Aeromonadaceae bacterium]
MEWISVNERFPEWPIGKNYIEVLCATDSGVVIAMTWAHYPDAKTERGRAPRWEWNWRVAPFVITHWMPLPPAP